MPPFPQIRYLYVVSEVFRHGRISDAADVVHLSQPAATQSLMRVEEALGTPLFDRSPQGMIATEAGGLFQPRLAHIFDHLQQGDRQARRKATRAEGEKPHKSFHRFCSPGQIRALLAVAKTGSFNQAAFELGISQPGVHRATRELASLAGFALFDQTRGGVVLSAPAEVFAHHARLAVSEFRQAVFEINEFLGRDITRIRLGSMPLSRSAILPAAIDELLGVAGDGVQVNCVDARYPSLLRDLRFGELDFLLGALRDPLPANDVEQEELFNDSLAIVVRPGHPLARQALVSLDDTLAYPWIAPPLETPSGEYLSNTLRIDERPDTPVRIVSSSQVMLRALLARGDYVSIASKRQIESDEQLGALVRLPIALPGSERAIGLTFRKGWRPTPIQNSFLDIIRRNAAPSDQLPEDNKIK